jgi:hypothetical protein
MRETLPHGDSHRAGLNVALLKQLDDLLGAGPCTSSANGRNAKPRSQAGKPSRVSSPWISCLRRMKSDIFRYSAAVAAYPARRAEPRSPAA